MIETGLLMCRIRLFLSSTVYFRLRTFVLVKLVLTTIQSMCTQAPEPIQSGKRKIKGSAGKLAGETRDYYFSMLPFDWIIRLLRMKVMIYKNVEISCV